MGFTPYKFKGKTMIKTPLSTQYESSSSFREAFSQIVDAASVSLKDQIILKVTLLDTKLGAMIAIADEKVLYLLEFFDPQRLESKIGKLRQKIKAVIVPGITDPIRSIESELNHYFEGTLKEFKTPLFSFGSSFQKRVWDELKKIPYGKTCSYASLAIAVDSPLAVRAVGSANRTNQIAIVIPCHRVINTNGGLGGYAGGLTRKEWLLQHEKQNC